VATSTLSALQLGTYNTGTEAWTAAVGSFVTLGGASQAWVQLDKTVPLAALATGLTCSFSTGWTETATLTFLAIEVPIAANFATGVFVPSPSRIVSTGSVDIVAGPNTITIPLSDAHSKATLIHSQARSRWRAHSGGGHRLAVGFAWDGAGGVTAITAFTLTHEEEFTGWGGQQAAAGTDRAVRCPRCGTVMRESALVQDGYTRSDVCAECFDPDPNALPKFPWPFRG
jgi:hypothetical protein